MPLIPEGASTKESVPASLVSEQPKVGVISVGLKWLHKILWVCCLRTVMDNCDCRSVFCLVGFWTVTLIIFHHWLCWLMLIGFVGHLEGHKCPLALEYSFIVNAGVIDPMRLLAQMPVGNTGCKGTIGYGVYHLTGCPLHAQLYNSCEIRCAASCICWRRNCYMIALTCIAFCDKILVAKWNW